VRFVAHAYGGPDLNKREGPVADIVFGMLVAVPALALIGMFIVERRRRTRPNKGAR
jgi:hypothetical protein